MKEKPITRWEAGNDLAAICDYMTEKEVGLVKDHPDIAKIIRRYRLELGDFFNGLNSGHGFGLPGTNEGDGE